MKKIVSGFKDFNPFRKIRRLEGELANLKKQLDSFKSRVDVSDDLFDRFQEDRTSESYQEVFVKRDPLVTVCVGTYNRGHLLLDRCLKSILNQDYKNIEVIVVGDCCTDDTEQLVAEIKDERLYFINLPERGKYPDNPQFRWMVAGTTTMNHALSLAKGDFITHLDDDDEYMPGRITKLVTFIQKTRADIIWHPYWRQNDRYKWRLSEGRTYDAGQVTTSSVFYHNWLKQIPWDINAYKYLEPGDWNRFRKIKYLGVKATRYDEPLLKHYREMQQIEK